MARVITAATRALAVESGELRTHVDILDWTGRNLLMSSRGPVGSMPRLDVVDGSVTTDDSRTVPGSGSLKVLATDATEADIVPFASAHPLSPIARARVQLWMGAAADDPSEFTPYGRYDVEDLDLEETSDGVTLSANFFDLGKRIEAAKFPGQWLVLQGTTYEQAVINMLIGVVADSDITFTPTAKKTSAHMTWKPGDDRLGGEHGLLSVAKSVGYRLTYNEGGVGILGFHPDTSETAAPAWLFVDGGNCRITSASRGLSTEDTYNGVIFEGESSGSDKPPAYGAAWDIDPHSLTYYDPNNPDASVFGPRPWFERSSLITTNGQAVNAAGAMLPKVLGMTERLSFDAIPNPGVETGDPIRVERPRIGAAGTYVVESVTLPFKASAGRMRVTCRERRVVT